MELIAKQEVVDSGYYELFNKETVKDINGNDVVIPRSVGSFNLSQLEQERANAISSHENYIADLDSKINAIKLAQNQ